ncbi:hypothetical protein EDD11_010341 [Mortierella claussenii]|nr:hypothetical protein EDD11_010341 [Mortierella claussenii]
MLGRKRIFSESAEYHAIDELFRHTFSATVLRLWDVSMEAEDLRKLAECGDDTVFSDLVMAGVEKLVKQHLDPTKIKDTSSANATLFLRDMMLYMEFSSAIRAGDIGRIEEVLRWLTIIFQAGSTAKYANELLHLHCGMRYAWDENTKHAILSSMLVNKLGKRYGWKPTDQYQEHNNRSIKHVHHGKGRNAAFDVLRERVSTNIETFDIVKTCMEKQFQAPSNKRKHAAVSAETDIHRILKTLSDNGILGQDPESIARQDPKTRAVKNLFTDGVIKLQDGKRISSFISRHTNGNQGGDPEPESADTERKATDFMSDCESEIEDFED